MRRSLLILALVSVVAIGFVPVASAATDDCSNCHPGRRLSPVVCKNCHIKKFKAWENSAHAKSLTAAGGMVAENPQCQKCHVESAIKENWNRPGVRENKENKEPITCETCHAPPEGGWFEHFGAGPHGAKKPEVSLAPENNCGRCHTGLHHPTMSEWNEYEHENFNPKTQASHSEPTEPYAKSKGCVACKSTGGAIKNLEKPGIFNRNEEELPAPKNVEEWRITCAACHEPHSAELRMEKKSKLCGNCHNSEMKKLTPDGETTEVHHSQWGMYKDSMWTTGKRHSKLGCPNCHMATRHPDEEAGIPANTGHTFDVNVELLGSKHLTGEVKCVNCHSNLETTIEQTQAVVEEKISEIESLKEEATAAIRTENNQKLISTYNNGLFYLSFVEHDASMGIHNFSKTSSTLQKSYSLLYQAKAGAEKLAQQSKVSDLESQLSQKKDKVSGLQSKVSNLQSKLENKYGLPFVIGAVIIGLIIGAVAVWVTKR
ncbi:hypothetical protein AKJ57_06385 [candidate division MSBL1 archaeon SCGC-AAA259A05]|uniref:Uncharacterized protein n=1 Tax=candidate division MSBL1 archaeon SCGC-AAA259A05 TaxID=1698259 RepID=A0A133U3I0_9EURY|nr:hypothetical protein AKJ57_06385 [candidate division MSBL1 archaeon SCGC-AAA259A05]